jgi:hypothetical protein
MILLVAFLLGLGALLVGDAAGGDHATLGAS